MYKTFVGPFEGRGIPINREIPKISGYLRAPLQNGVGRYVPQLQRITFKFCKSHGGSRGVREFIEKYIVDWARQNPATVVYLKPRRHRSPCLVAEYCHGEREYMSLQKFEAGEILKWAEHLK